MAKGASLLLATVLLASTIGLPVAAAEDPAAEGAVEAPPRFEIGGSLRTRFEYKDDFRFLPGGGGGKVPGNEEELFLTQLRLQLDWRASDRLRFHAELQDARIFNESTAINDDAAPNIFADDLDLHQAYLDADLEIARQPARLRLGRQKFNLGAMRLVASLEWVNTARVWDGARLTVGREQDRTLDVFLSRVVPVDPGSPNDWAKLGSRPWDSAFHGLYFTDWQWIPGGRLELYYLLRDGDDFDDEIHTFGSRLERKLDGWDVHLELVFQSGTFSGLDHRASALHAEIGRQLGKGRLGLAYNYGSGDSDPNDGEHETFDNLYPLNHAYYGYMDFFALQNVHNAELVWRLPLPGKTVLRLAQHGFWLVETTDAWYNAGGGVVRRDPTATSSYVGAEFDLTVSRPFTLGARTVATELGYGHFFTGDYVTQTGPDEDADFVYLQAKIGF